MKPIRLRRLFAATTIFLSSAALSCGAYVGYLQLSGNFHEVVAGKLYRSAQPSAGQLQAYIKDHGIKTVINLRGTNPQQEWYRNELAVSQSLGVKHVDFGISASKFVPSDKAAALIGIMATAEKPILIHCESGADRSGLASALYLMSVTGDSAEDAERQLSFYYGHVGLPHISSAYAMDRSFEDYEALDRRQASATSAHQIVR